MQPRNRRKASACVGTVRFVAFTLKCASTDVSETTGTYKTETYAHENRPINEP